MNEESKLYQAFDSDPSPIAEFLQWLAIQHDLPSKLHVLDVGCGPGRMFKHFARLGWHAIGYEPNKSFSETATQQAASFGFTVEQGGFNDISENEAFDLICGINSSFAHVLEPAQRFDAFNRAHEALRKGGILFLDLPNLLRVLMEYGGPRAFTSEVDGRPVRLERRHEVDYHRAVFTTLETYAYLDDGGAFTKVHPYAIVSYAELSYQLKQVGFDNIQTYRSHTSREGRANRRR